MSLLLPQRGPASPSEHRRLPLALRHRSVTWPPTLRTTREQMQTLPPPPIGSGGPHVQGPGTEDTDSHTGRPRGGRKPQVFGGRGHLRGLREAVSSSVWPAAGLQVRPLAGGQHPRVVSGLRKRPLAAAPVGPSTVPLADVPVQDVLDVLHNQVDGDCTGTDKSVSAGRALCPLADVCPAPSLRGQEAHVQAWHRLAGWVSEHFC